MSDFVGFTTGPTATQAKVQTEGTVCLQRLLSYYYLSVTHSRSVLRLLPASASI